MVLFGPSYKLLEDEALMRLSGLGDAKAFEELYDRYGARMCNYFRRMLWNDREKAEDFMQDLFTKILRKPGQFDSSRSFRTWIYSVAFNMCKNEYRKAGVRKDAHMELSHSTSGSTEGSEMINKIDGKKFNIQLYQELDKMDEDHRNTFILRYRDDLSIREISEVFECSEGTVKSRLFYTLRKLTTKLKLFDPGYKSITP